MALGLARDSMQDLRSLIGEKEVAADECPNETAKLLLTGESAESSRAYEKLGQASSSHTADKESDRSSANNSVAQVKPIDLGESSNENNDTGPGQGNPQEDFEEEEKKHDPATASYGNYSGFSNDYSDYAYDPYNAYQYGYGGDPQTLLGGQKKSDGGIFCCLFPWINSGSSNEYLPHEDEATKKNAGETKEHEEELVSDHSKPIKSSASADDDNMSVGGTSVASEDLGERLSEKDRQAVLARLRLAQPDQAPATTNGSGTPETKETGTDANTATPEKKEEPKGLLKDIPQVTPQDTSSAAEDEEEPKPRGILRRTTKQPKNEGKEKNKKGNDQEKRRRSLFPTYETQTPRTGKEQHVQFAPMARVVTVKSQKDMSEEEKSSIWWQKWDYDDFRKTGRLITRAMLTGGSEIWLAGNESWRETKDTPKSATLQKAISLSESGSPEKNGTSDVGSLIESARDKWWHKFGHSRRGLEHIASIAEGQERQANVRQAIKTVLDEQRRHKVYHREDPEKLRIVALHNTSWARDLALAAGASDADAVKCEFKEERRTREFYLENLAKSNSANSSGKHIPSFMKPVLTTFTNKLDANTHAQIMYRQKQQREQRRELAQKLSVTVDKAVPSTPPPADTPRTPEDKSMEPIHDPKPSDHQDLARRAAGFSHEGAEKVDMAAVLGGMGPIPHEQTVGAH